MLGTMTRLPTDSFLPSGAIGAGNDSHVISPLSLNQTSYFDSNYIRQHRYLSPDSNPPIQRSPRSSSLSPTRHRVASTVTSPSVAPTSNPGVTSPLENMSGHQVAAMLQRKEEHNRRLLESWQNERNHLEASRARAEEMFREERDMMDEERLLWVAEKSKLENELIEWRRRAEAAERERDILMNTFSGRQAVDGAFDTRVLSNAQVRSPSSSLSPGTAASVSTRGSTMPESKPFQPLDPRMQSASPSATTPPNEQDRVPLIDVSEAIPGLEGIRLKAPAIQKPTFMDGKPPSPPIVSKSSPSGSEKTSPRGLTRSSSKELTQEVLLAPEHRRLTIHAGHTPNHSMSLSRLQTAESTEVTNTAGSSGTSTPKHPGGDASISQKGKELELARPQPPNDGRSHGRSEILEDRHDSKMEEAVYVPSDDDPELKGPLHLKNRPAADEIFLRRLSDKLEQVKASNSPPSAVLEPIEPSDPPREPLKSEEPTAANTDGASDTAQEFEEPIPLKFKKTSNFGLPLGQAGTSGF
ncbi:hypothetical protein F5Y15DRAFT_83694 [Xylariaceae sp. FL0016]|nr:hypothetical protein F5Y15DRAFT_83694 [Xylariaceae sp. FL0016]